jgi:hypothetical protein
LLITMAIIIAAMGVLSFLFVPYFDNEIDPSTEGGFKLSDFTAALRNPVVIWAALTMFFVYFVYTSITYTTQWLGVVGVSAAIIATIANIRSYGVGIAAGPVAGTLTKRIGSTSKMIIIAFILAILVLLLFIFTAGHATTLAVILTVLLGFICVGTFNITSGQLSEARVPTAIFGAATGLLSLIGFLPDTFRDIWFGNMLDRGAATTADGSIPLNVFNHIWWIVIAACVLAMLCALQVLRLAKQRAAEEDSLAPLSTGAPGVISEEPITDWTETNN